MTKLYVTALAHIAGLKVSREEKGATAVEYGLLVALIAAVIVGAVIALGGEITAAFNTVVNAIPGGAPAAP